MKAKSFFALLLSVLLLASLFAGCSQDSSSSVSTSGSSSSTTSTQVSDPVDDPFAEHLEISFSTSLGVNATELTDNPVISWLEEKYNITIELVRILQTDAEQTNLLLAAGDAPDAFYFYKDPAEMAKQGIIRSIPEEMIREHAPDIAAFMDENPVGWTMSRMPDVENGGFIEGEYARLTGYTDESGSAGWINVFRKDWLDNLSIGYPGPLTEISDGVYWCEEGYTLEQFTDIVKAFTDGDPDGNGQKDTLGMSNTPSFVHSWGALMGAFGLGSWQGNFISADGTKTRWDVSDEYRDFLAYISEMAQLGYMDSEAPTMTLAMQWEKYSSGQLGWVSTYLGYADPLYSTRPPMNVLENAPNAEVLITAPTSGPGGQSTIKFGDNKYAQGVMISKDVDDAKLARILRIQNDMAFDDETFVKTYFGEPGLAFDWEGEEWNSKAVAKTDLTENEKAAYNGPLGTISFYPPEMNKYRWTSTVKTMADFFEYSAAGQKMLKHFNDFDDYDYLYTDELAEWNEKYLSEWQLISDTYYADAVTGGNVEATWDQYIADMKANAGLEERLELMAKLKTTDEQFGALK